MPRCLARGRSMEGDPMPSVTMARRADISLSPPGPRPLLVALAASIVTHSLLALLFRPSPAPPRPEPPAEIAPADRWSGTTAELPGHSGLYDLDVGAAQGARLSAPSPSPDEATSPPPTSA